MMDHILDFLVAVISGWLASVEWRLRMLNKDVAHNPSRKEVAELIDMKQEAVKAMQQQIKEDLDRLEDKIDKLIERSSPR